MKKVQNSKGFAIIETALFLVIIGLISFVGWYIWNAKAKTDQSLTPLQTSSNSSASRPQKEQSENDEADCRAIIAEVKASSEKDPVYEPPKEYFDCTNSI